MVAVGLFSFAELGRMFLRVGQAIKFLKPDSNIGLACTHFQSSIVRLFM